MVEASKYFGWDEVEESLSSIVIRKPTFSLAKTTDKKIYWLLIGLIVIAFLFFFLSRF